MFYFIVTDKVIINLTLSLLILKHHILKMKYLNVEVNLVHNLKENTLFIKKIITL